MRFKCRGAAISKRIFATVKFPSDNGNVYCYLYSNTRQNSLVEGKKESKRYNTKMYVNNVYIHI